MMKRWFGVLCLVGAFALLAGQAPQIVQAQADGEPEIVLSGLNGPQGVLVAPDGSVWAIDSGLGGNDIIESVDTVTGSVGEAPFGNSARVVRTTDDGQEDVASLPSVVFGEELVGGARLALLDGELYVTNGFWTGHESYLPPAIPGMAAIMRIVDGEAVEIANITDLEADENPDGTIYETHPYGIAAGPDGNLWVADAGANMLYTVSPEGDVEVVTVFDGIPGVFPSPTRGGEMVTDPVPTGITFDADGNAYVSYLSGAPFVPGSAKVVSINEDGSYDDYATGLTMLTDLRTAPNGDMFAVTFAIFGEQGPQMNSGSIVRVLPGEDSEVVLTGLSFPTSIDFNEDGDAFIAINGVGPPGSGAVIRVAGLMDAEAVEMAEMEETEPVATAEPEEEAEEAAEATATPVAEEEAEAEMAEATATPVAEEEAEEEMAEATATPVAEEEAEAEMAEATATPVAEEEAEEEMAEATATPVAEEEAEAEMAEATATPVAEEEMAEEDADDSAPGDLPATGGSGPSLPLIIGLVLVVVAGLGINVWRTKRQAV